MIPSLILGQVHAHSIPAVHDKTKLGLQTGACHQVLVLAQETALTLIPA
jgi:hypothetical protein